MSGIDVVQPVVAAAAKAARPWADKAAGDRAHALDAAAAALDAAAADLVPVAAAETRLPEGRLTGEVARTTGQLRMFAGVLRDGSYVDAVISQGDPAAGRADVRRMLVPIGPVAVFGASNFPFAFSVAGGDTASALAAGCPVVAKVHDGHPRTSEMVAAIVAGALTEAGAPPGVLGLVAGLEAGRALVQHPQIRAVGFTGSVAGGRALFDLAASRRDPIPFYGELGSLNPVVVLPGAARQRPAEIAAGYAASLTLGVGQFCTKPGLLLVPDDPGLLAEVADAVRASTGGPMLTERIRDLFEQAVGEPAWQRQPLLAEGSAADDTAAVPQVRTAVVAELTGTEATELTRERFGPAGLVVTYPTVADLLGVIPRLPGSLAGCLHAADDELADAAAVGAELRRIAGRLVMNGWPTGVAVNWAMQHGGPWPSSTSPEHTSVGMTAIRRWLSPVAYQDWPDQLLPPALQRANPLGINRTVQPF